MSGPAYEGSAPAFRHEDAGTPEPDWLLDPRWDAVPSLPALALADGVERVVVVAAHPDDEVLGAGATLADLSTTAADVVVVVATDGAGAYSDAGPAAAALAAVRRDEEASALARVAPDARLVHLDLPDRHLSAHTGALAASLDPLVTSSTLLLAPWRRDGHADHDAAGAVAAAVAEARGARLLEFPIWLWQWGRPDDLPWPQVLLVGPSAAALHAKQAAVAEHRSQLLPGGPRLDQAPILGRHVLRRFERVVETFVCWPTRPPGADATPVEHSLDTMRPDAAHSDAAHSDATRPDAMRFDSMYDVGEDPWGFETSWYEQRKRSLTMAMLGRPRYGTGLEIGCATGVLTRALAERTDHVVGMDVSSRALAIARRTGVGDGAATVTWLHGSAPAAIPDGPFDLVVLSEVGYFLNGAQWLATLRRVRAALRPDGEVVLVHWRRRTDGIPLDGPLVQQQARAALGLGMLASYADPDVEIDVLGDAAPVAVREGLT